MKKWKAMPLGLIIFLLFNKYLGILSVLESKRHLTYAGHLAALMGNSSLLSQLHAHSIRQIPRAFYTTSVNKSWWYKGHRTFPFMHFFFQAY